jgi:protein-S-isoprenylcysteine O-methyltransferase Ste14
MAAGPSTRGVTIGMRDQGVGFFHNLTPMGATIAVWGAWALSWVVAAIWSRRTVGRPEGVGATAYYVPTFLGGVMLFSSAARHTPHPFGEVSGERLWSLPSPVGWLLCAATAASFAFAWWARLWLGSLWSGTVTRKADHRVIDTGPYRLVRHPIYTALIAAGFILAAEIGTLAAIVGASLMTLGWWMKARVEERFLTRELGPAYEAYRRRTAMLIPFLKPPG